ncbi:uncharacterized protein N7459_007456 [Penicillium hispanicum]|uniref:uncharacterized protein n=1 Tax=Penicillium hispanicum TaxID=1080232 RepID=UPI002540E1AF|nr:uncharacterized protein N7459_007456 [Penicillium hispanicum]KAJ5578492.1 hypothetical protein N7459_007456 [Penicillium hispanicum]
MKLTYIPWMFSALAAVAAAVDIDDLCVPYLHHDGDYTLQLLCPHSETNIPANDCVDNDNGKLVARPYGNMGESCTDCNVNVLPSVSDVYLRYDFPVNTSEIMILE